jgi:hypothetical protein
MKVANAGELPVRVTADPRLLVLEVTPPPAYVPADAKKKGPAAKPPTLVKCILPDDVRPRSDAGPDLVVPGGRSWSATIDPLFYCFGAKERALLVKGATVTPRLGWPEPAAKPLTRARGAKPAAPSPPFVASPVGAAVGKLGPMKEIAGASITLAEDVLPPPPSSAPASSEAPPSDLTLSVAPAADVARGVDVNVTVTLANAGARSTTVLFRSSTLGFKVNGPSGSIACGNARSIDAPVRELFTTLAPKGTTSLSLLVDAVCPSDTFDEPGVYRVVPRLDTTNASGRTIGLRTFEGVVEGEKPMLVRVRAPRRPKPPVRPSLD